jgi:hypothetical protein
MTSEPVRVFFFYEDTHTDALRDILDNCALEEKAYRSAKVYNPVPHCTLTYCFPLTM